MRNIYLIALCFLINLPSHARKDSKSSAVPKSSDSWKLKFTKEAPTAGLSQNDLAKLRLDYQRCLSSKGKRPIDLSNQMTPTNCQTYGTCSVQSHAGTIEAALFRDSQGTLNKSEIKMNPSLMALSSMAAGAGRIIETKKIAESLSRYSTRGVYPGHSSQGWENDYSEKLSKSLLDFEGSGAKLDAHLLCSDKITCLDVASVKLSEKELIELLTGKVTAHCIEAAKSKREISPTEVTQIYKDTLAEIIARHQSADSNYSNRSEKFVSAKESLQRLFIAPANKAIFGERISEYANQYDRAFCTDSPQNQEYAKWLEPLLFAYACAGIPLQTTLSLMVNTKSETNLLQTKDAPKKNFEPMRSSSGIHSYHAVVLSGISHGKDRQGSLGPQLIFRNSWSEGKAGDKTQASLIKVPFTEACRIFRELQAHISESDILRLKALGFPFDSTSIDKPTPYFLKVQNREELQTDNEYRIKYYQEYRDPEEPAAHGAEN